jgi:hypothetical protein
MNDSVKERFDELKKIWLEETKDYSRVLYIIAHPAYEEIIEMGLAALPLIIADLKDGLRADPPVVHHWFFALQKITDRSPVPINGDLQQMAQRWILWAEESLEKKEIEKVSS